ncbi:MAG: phosphohydrolase [Candidatus Shapirobacteria bacterium]|jgi:predicted hydrolase (HD superfamily)
MNFDRTKFDAAVKDRLEQNIYFHSLSLEACMGGLFDYFKDNNLLTENDPAKEYWTTSGLIHDIDYSLDTKELHPLRTREVLAKYNLEIDDVLQKIILAHDARQGINKTNKAEWSLYCADSLTGLITAVAFVYPDRKLSSVKVSSVVKRFLKEPKFAAGTRRNEVAECSQEEGLNLPLEKFIEICLTSMQSIASQIGL